MKYKLTCESCGKEQIYDNLDDAFNDGWDYPPRMGMFGVVSPRTCGDCVITETVYWKIMCSGSDNLNTHDIEVIERIKKEPESLYVM